MAGQTGETEAQRINQPHAAHPGTAHVVLGLHCHSSSFGDKTLLWSISESRAHVSCLPPPPVKPEVQTSATSARRRRRPAPVSLYAGLRLGARTQPRQALGGQVQVAVQEGGREGWGKVGEGRRAAHRAVAFVQS